MDLKEIYNSRAVDYQRLIDCEDASGYIARIIQHISPIQGRDVLDLGSGTGRLAVMFAPQASRVVALDISPHMLRLAAHRLADSGLSNWMVTAADHQAIPVPGGSADVVMAGWSLVYAAIWAQGSWQASLQRALDEIQRVLRPGGALMVLETLGTGTSQPQPPEEIRPYLAYLNESGFESTWIRTDYRFQDRAEAEELVSFFFGAEMLSKIVERGGATTLPECTGLWWRRKPEK